MVAVVVDQALAVAEQVALPLHALVEIVRIDAVAARQARIDDLDAGPVEVDAGIAGVLPDHVVAAEQDRRAELLAGVGDGGAHDLFFLALGEDDALGLAADAVVDALQRRGDRVAPRRQFLLVLLEVEDRLARDAGIHRRAGDGQRNGRDQARIERHRDDVVGAEFRAACPDRRRRRRRARPGGRGRPAPARPRPSCRH